MKKEKKLKKPRPSFKGPMMDPVLDSREPYLSEGSETGEILGDQDSCPGVRRSAPTEPPARVVSEAVPLLPRRESA